MIYREKLEKMALRFADIERELSLPETAKEQSRFQKLSKELAQLRPLIETYREYCQVEKELSALNDELSGKALDHEMRALYQEEKRELEARLARLMDRVETLLLKEADPYSGRDILIEIRAGTGGEEAALFAADLFRMYARFASARDLRVEVMSSNETGKGGFKEIVFAISGAEAYSFFKYERGIHRVQRVPETESSGRIHTSAVTVALMVEADESEVNLDPQDLKIDVFRASGAGGQHVNKTESAVRITHIPTGAVVSCQDERSQHKNKAKALRVLRARIYEAQEEKRQKEMAQERRQQVGSGDRSGKIRTYNFPDQRVTDHRIGLTLHGLNDILNGHLDELVDALGKDERNRRLNDAA